MTGAWQFEEEEMVDIRLGYRVEPEWHVTSSSLIWVGDPYRIPEIRSLQIEFSEFVNNFFNVDKKSHVIEIDDKKAVLGMVNNGLYRYRGFDISVENGMVMAIKIDSLPSLKCDIIANSVIVSIYGGLCYVDYDGNMNVGEHRIIFE